MSDTVDDTTHAPASPEPGAGTADNAPAGTPAPDAGHQGDADLDLLADGGDDTGEDTGAEGDEPEASDARTEADEPKASPFLERPESLSDATPEDIAAWKAEQGLPDREEYQLPELDEGQKYSNYGKALSEKIVQLGYDLDLSPAQAQQLVLRGDTIIKTLAEARDREDNKIGSKALLDEFDGDREAVRAHVAQARATLRKALPEGLSKVILEARGPDGRKLAYNTDFLRWASELDARPQAKGRTMTQDLEAELAEIDAAMHQDVASLYRPWKATGRSASDRRLEISRQLDNDAATLAHHAADRDAGSDEERELLALHRNDPAFFEHGRWKNGAISPAKRLYNLRNKP